MSGGPGRGDEGHPIAQMILLGIVLSLIGIAISLWIDWFPAPAGESATDIDTLYDVLLVVSVPVFVLVMTVAIYSVIRFRARPGDMSDGAPIHGNTRLEVVWVTIPFIIVSVLAAYGWIVLDDIEAKKANTMVVNVTAQQFTWTFEYPEGGRKVRSTNLVLPKDRPVEFRVNSKDVIHSFWVPELRLKTDTVPGLTTKIRVTPSRTGNWNVVCAELCGIGHSTMRAPVRVMEAAAFDRWLEARRGPAPAGGGAQADGRQIFTNTGCGGCHTLGDAKSNGTIGPNLDDLAAEAARFGKRRGQSAQEYVRESIEKPGAFTVPGFPKGVMPDDYSDQLSAAEIDALVQYVLRVSGGKP